jgi:redox-sensitive bicupin YhaK (pirin superfamily)
MVTVRRSEERGRFDFGWLDTRHTFSFGRYVDRRHMGFRALRVINEDVVAPGRGFGAHPHEDMEILSYVLSGELAHTDSLGHTRVLRPGMIQRMSAGTGIEHSEFNPSKTQPVHFLQIWLLPERAGAQPGYEEAPAPAVDATGWAVLASRDGSGAVRVNQDVRLLLAEPKADRPARLALSPGRHAWVQVVEGEAVVLGQRVKAGDGLAVSDEAALVIESAGAGPARALVFDLA